MTPKAELTLRIYVQRSFILSLLAEKAPDTESILKFTWKCIFYARFYGYQKNYLFVEDQVTNSRILISWALQIQLVNTLTTLND